MAESGGSENKDLFLEKLLQGLRDDNIAVLDLSPVTRRAAAPFFEKVEVAHEFLDLLTFKIKESKSRMNKEQLSQYSLGFLRADHPAIRLQPQVRRHPGQGPDHLLPEPEEPRQGHRGMRVPDPPGHHRRRCQGLPRAAGRAVPAEAQNRGEGRRRQLHLLRLPRRRLRGRRGNPGIEGPKPGRACRRLN